MITITDKTQRIFFEPKAAIIGKECSLTGWLLDCGFWSDIGFWDETATWQDTPDSALFAVKGVVLTNVGTIKAESILNVSQASRVPSIGLELFNGLPDEDYIFIVEYINDIAPIVIDYFNRVAEDSGQSQQTIVEVTQRLMKIAQIETLEKQIYQSRLKILRQSVERVKRSQPVTTRKVNRTVTI